MKHDELLKPVSESDMEALDLVVMNYEVQSSEAEEYLTARGIGSEVASTFRLGVVGGDDVPPDHERYRGMLAIPYLDHKGRALSVRFRCTKDHDHRERHHGKYNSLPGEASRMYNIRQIFEADRTISITEGEFEAVILTMIGIPAVALPGVNSWRPHHKRMLAGFSRVWVWGDPDEAGVEFGKKICRDMPQARRVPIKNGDVNETYLAEGEEALWNLIGGRK